MPRSQCRNRVRNRGAFRLNKDTRMVCLFNKRQDQEDDHRLWDFITVSERHAEQLENDCVAERVMAEVDGDIRTVGWRMKETFQPGYATHAMLTEFTMHSVANGKNSELTPGERRQVEKYIAWPLIGDTRAVCVRPRISEVDRHRAERLLGRRAA